MTCTLMHSRYLENNQLISLTDTPVTAPIEFTPVESVESVLETEQEKTTYPHTSYNQGIVFKLLGR
jgi:hypothetical protein